MYNKGQTVVKIEKGNINNVELTAADLTVYVLISQHQSAGICIIQYDHTLRNYQC